jgi:hypothetical protein
MVVAGNVVLGDLGRRRFSPPLALGAGIFSLVMTGCFSYAGVALSTILLGGFVAGRHTAPGRYHELRKQILFLIGATVSPLATIASTKLVTGTAPGEPIPIGLAAYHALYWLPTAGVDAALAWSAARAVLRRREPDATS